MNIDKAEMKNAYYNREGKAEMDKLIKMFYEMATYFVNKFGISTYHRNDYIQFAVTRAFNKLHLYDPDHINDEGKISAVFSYFYKVIYMEVRYRMRDTRMKKERRPNTCSYETISAIIEDKNSEQNIVSLTQEDEERHIIVDGRVFNRDEILTAAKQAKKLLNKVKRNVDFVPETTDPITLELYGRLKEEYNKSLVEA